MSTIEDTLAWMRRNPKGVRITGLCRVCERFFGKARQHRTGHRVYKTPWEGDPRVNVQNSKGMAKTYQVRQVIKAIERVQYEKQAH